MRSFTTTEARQNFAAVLEQARRDGAVRIQRRDGQAFVLFPEQPRRSPLDVPGIVPAKPISLDDIVAAAREGRERDG